MSEWEFTDSRILDQSKLTFPISDLFIHSSLLSLLTLAFPFNSTFVREFYANLIVIPDHSRIISRVQHKDIEFTKEDLATYLNISTVGPKAHDIANSMLTNWTAMNLVLRDSNYNRHTASVVGLTQNARIVQHVIRHTLLPKAGDRTNITPLLSVVTYFCLTSTTFDVADALFRYMENIISYTDPRYKRKHNLALGHVISFLILSKYALVMPTILDHQPTFFTNSSFHILYGKGKGKRAVDESEEQEEAQERAPAQGESSAPPPPPPGGEDFTSQLGRIEGRLNQFIIQSTEQWKKYEANRMEDRQYYKGLLDDFLAEAAKADSSDPEDD